jgi:hypothetical protein
MSLRTTEPLSWQMTAHQIPTLPPPVGISTNTSLPDSVALMICSWWPLKNQSRREKGGHKNKFPVSWPTAGCNSTSDVNNVKYNVTSSVSGWRDAQMRASWTLTDKAELLERMATN